MRFRESTLGRAIHWLPGGGQILELGRKTVGVYYRLRAREKRRQESLAVKRNSRQAFRRTGIEYRPLLGSWKLYRDGELDAWFTARFPDGEEMKIHLTQERGYQDLDGMAHVALYEKFVSDILPRSGFRADNASRILDCACGSGYGSNYIQEKLGCPVIGVDLDGEVIRYAQKRYTPENPSLTYAQADITDLHLLESGSIRSIVSIETIEHLPDPERAVVEFRRILAPAGILFVSTPDASYRPGTLITKFHMREFSRAEFEGLLRHEFPSVEITNYRQDPDLYLLAVCRA